MKLICLLSDPSENWDTDELLMPMVQKVRLRKSSNKLRLGLNLAMWGPKAPQYIHAYQHISDHILMADNILYEGHNMT